MPRYLKRFTIAGLACLPLAYLCVVRMQALGRFDTEGYLYTAYCSVVLAGLGGAVIAATVSIVLRLSGQWPGAFKLWLCTLLGTASVLWSLLRWAHIREALAPTGGKRFIRVGTAIQIVALIVVESIFMTWVTWGPPLPW